MKWMGLFFLTVLFLKGKGCDEPHGDSVPPCIAGLIEEFENKTPASPPPQIFEYDYKNQKVYYVLPPCCDQMSKVYDAQCNFLGSPDGGFTGKGDGKLPDFFTERTNEKLIWKDSRTPDR